MAPLQRLLLATTNPGKIRELAAPLAAAGFALVGLRDLGITAEAPETGRTFLENARQKAEFYFSRAAMPTLANGIAWPDAVRFANAAAGLEVQVFGVVPMPIEKIHREVMMLEGVHAGMAGKVRTLEQLLVEVAAHRNDGKKIVFTNGCFDVLHAGHVQYLRFAELRVM